MRTTDVIDVPAGLTPEGLHGRIDDVRGQLFDVQTLVNSVATQCDHDEAAPLRVAAEALDLACIRLEAIAKGVRRLQPQAVQP